MSIILSREGANPKVSGHFFKAVVQVVLLFWDRDMDPDPPDGAGPDQISAQGRATAHREASGASGGGALRISSYGGGNVRIRIRGDWGINHEEAEYGCAIYCDATEYGPL